MPFVPLTPEEQELCKPPCTHPEHNPPSHMFVYTRNSYPGVDASASRRVSTRAVHDGIYRLQWKDGGSSVASVGSDSKGRSWFAPSNWIGGQPSFDWASVRSFELIVTQEEKTADSRPEWLLRLCDRLLDKLNEEEISPSTEDARDDLWTMITNCFPDFHLTPITRREVNQ